MDFQAIADKLSTARLVGIGESTHGTHEFFMSKVKLFKNLVEQHSFNTLMLEDGRNVCKNINAYIQTGEGNLSAIMSDLYSVWRVSELADLIHWLRENRTSYQVNFVGFDIAQSTNDASRRDELMARNISSYLDSNLNSHALIWAHNSHIKTSSEDKEFKPMGMFLRNKFGEKYVAIAQFFGLGQFNATHINVSSSDSKDITLQLVTVESIPADLLEHGLNKLNDKPFFLAREEFKSKNLTIKTYAKVRSIGWGLVPRRLNEYVEGCNLVQEFDGLIYYPTAAASQPL